MAYTILQGVKQKPNGQLYRTAAYPNGKIIEIPYEETARVYPWMEQVEVESYCRPGTTYMSLKFYHQRSL